ncbi:MAG TPA: glycosyltransferase, partial [Chloroflexota bacterium]|nr:glycosyltransferase [Chloroflexota bacterium]
MPPEPTRLTPVLHQTETVSVVIPSWTGKVARVVASVEAQTYKDLRVEVVKGVSPAARARNIGVGRTSGRLILFVDDDAYLGHERVVERLVEALEADDTIGVVGPSMLVPPDANSFQRTLAEQAPRWEFPVQQEDLESNPPLDHYGHTGITTTCCMLRRELFEAMGGFDETLPTGPEDTDFFFRVRREGYRFVVPRQCWVYHYPPRELKVMFR